MIAVLVPMIMAEPYPRVLVGIQIDSGSRLFTLLGSTFVWLAVIFGGLAGGLYVVVNWAMGQDVVSSFASRFIGASPAVGSTTVSKRS